jgi:hypothetical protein
MKEGQQGVDRVSVGLRFMSRSSSSWTTMVKNGKSEDLSVEIS